MNSSGSACPPLKSHTLESHCPNDWLGLISYVGNQLVNRQPVIWGKGGIYILMDAPGEGG